MNEQKGWKFKLGIVLLGLSVLLFFGLVSTPFLPVTIKTKLIITTTIVVVSKFTFWIGGYLVGKVLFNKYKSYLRPKFWIRTIKNHCSKHKIN